MLKFSYSTVALILAPVLLPAHTPKPGAVGANSNSSRSGVITGRVTDPQGQPIGIYTSPKLCKVL
jgi:hypothetical protein